MAQILAFPATDRNRTDASPKGPATIVFFTGVRYERLDPKAAAAPRRRKTRRKA